MDGETQFISEKTAARLLGLSTLTLWKYRTGRSKARLRAALPFYQYGRRVLYDRREVLAWRELHHRAFIDPTAAEA